MIQGDVHSRACAGAAASEQEGSCDRERLQSPQRRILLTQAIAAGLGLTLGDAAGAAEPSSARPQAGDIFVFVSGDNAGHVISPSDLAAGAAPVLAWPMEPASKIVRDGSRLNQVLLLRLDEAALDDETRAHAAEGIVAYSAACTHALCPVTGWKAEERTLRCHCHNSEFDPSQGAKVVFGPAPRPLPALPLGIADGTLSAAGPFRGKVGQPS